MDAGDNRKRMANLPSVVDQIDRLFDELIHRRWGTAAARIQPAQVRTVDDGWEIEVPVPELTAKDLEVEVSGRELRVQGTGRKEAEQRWTGTSARSWSWSSRRVSFSRSFLLPETVDPADVDARYENGVLHIHVRRRVKR
mgnify:CR=1 FL=1